MRTFTPYTIKTLSIKEELRRASEQKQFPLKALDFEILSYKTLYSTDKKDYKVVSDKNMEKIQMRANMLNKKLSLRQEYEILVRPLKKRENFNLDFTLIANKTKTAVYAVIKESSTIPLVKGIDRLIYEKINEKKAQFGFLVGLFEEGLKDNIKRLLAHLQRHGSLGKDQKILVAQGYEPEAGCDDKVIKHYAMNQAESSFIDAIGIDELVLEYIKPKMSGIGRDCTGTFIDKRKPNIEFPHKLPIIKDHFRIEEDEDTAKYYSSKEGYVNFNDGKFLISNEVALESASYKDIGAIKTGDKEISVNISQDDSSMDAISSGVEIDVAELNVKGSLGSNTKVSAKRIDVGTQTHRNATIEAQEEAHVHLHRGNLKAKDATIEILETGTIEAETVKVNRMIGGEIRARTVEVVELCSNAKIIATERINITCISGEGNKLIIDPTIISGHKEELDKMFADFKAMQKELRKKEAEYERKQRNFLDLTESTKRFQKKAIDFTKRGQKPPPSITVRLKQFQIEAKRMEEFQNEIKECKTQITEIESNIQKNQEIVFHSKVKCEGTWNGCTEVIFMLPNAEQELKYVPTASEDEIFLIKDDEGNAKVSWV